MNVLEGLRAARVELLVADGVGPHHVPLGRDVVLLQVHAQLDVVVLALLVDVPEVDLRFERNTLILKVMGMTRLLLFSIIVI